CTQCRSTELRPDFRDSIEQLARRRPDIYVTGLMALLDVFGESHPNKAMRTELETRNRGPTLTADARGLRRRQPVTDTRSEEIWQSAQRGLRSREARLEVVESRLLAAEEPVKGKAVGRNRDDDDRARRKLVVFRTRKNHLAFDREAAFQLHQAAQLEQ